MVISVLVPFYNRIDYLQDALDGITTQTYKKWQAILYDDGSTDLSSKIAEAWLENNPGFLVRDEKNRGVGHARNRLLELIDTPYAAWMDSDDWSLPNRLEWQMKELQKTQADIVFSYLRFCRGDLVQCQQRVAYTIDVSKYTSREGLYNNMAFATGLFKSELKEFTFREDIDRKEDVDWMVQLINANKKFACLKQDLYHVRQHDNRLTPKP